MENEKIKIIDDSGDKKYFTIIPNYILNHSTIYDREVYIQMKRVAGESGTCYQGHEQLAKRIGIGRQKLEKSIKYLLNNNWIEFVGKHPGKTKSVNEYRIIDLWDINNSYYNQKKIGVLQTESLIQTKRSECCRRKDRSVADGEEEPIKENLNIDNAETSSALSVFNYKEEINKLKTDPKRHIQFIGEYIEEKNIPIESKEQLQVCIKRHLRSAVQLAKFSNERVGYATEVAEKEYPSYTLDTLIKILTR